MSDPDDRTLKARLQRLPGQVLLALVNGTAILVIAASILALVAAARITHLAHDVAETMTDAVLSTVDLSPRQFQATVQTVSADIRDLTETLQETRAEAAASLDPALARLNAKLAAIESGVEDLTEVRGALIKETVAQVSVAVGEELQRFGTCKAAEIRH